MEMAQRTYASPPSDLSVLERQRARLVTNWSREHQHQQQQHQNVGSCDQFPFFHLLDNNVIDGTKNEGHGSQVYNPLPCTGSSRGKPDDPTNPKEGATDSSEISASSKRIREDNTAMAAVGEDKKSTTETQKPSKKKAATSNKEGSKESTVTSGAPPSKPDYIHVRARRGQATDSHSLAERVRRERISERMKYLQDLVPGCNNIIGKAGMLDEIINYVQSLQRQVEFLSMKLAAVNPLVDLSMDNFISGKINPAFNGGLTAIEVLPAQEDPPYLQPNSLQQAQPGTGCGLGMAMDTAGMALHSSLNAPQPLADPFFGSCFNVHGSSGWEIGLQNNYASNIQARGVALPIQSLQSNLLPNDLKMV